MFCDAGTCHQAAVLLSTGNGHSCVVLKDGTIRCWGDNGYGELGDLGSAAGTSDTPVIPGGTTGALSGVTALSVGTYHTCAVESDGSVWCWGEDVSAQLGSMVTTQINHVPATVTPTRVPSFPPSGLKAKAIGAGSGHTCAVLSDGTVWCWGSNYAGQLGAVSTMMINTNPVSYVPLKVNGLPAAATAVSAGYDESCAVLSDGTVWCWGANVDGDLGNNAAGTQSMTPVKVSGLAGATAIACSDESSFACATCTAGVCCWGDDTTGQLGNNTSSTFSAVPVTPQGLSGAVTVAAGTEHACATLPDGTAWCWGSNRFAELGSPTFNPFNGGNDTGSLVPAQVVSPGVGFTGIGAGGVNGCGLGADGSVWCWGTNDAGQLGNPISSTNTPVQVTGW
jgi:alpha-tubulin suppressor-like RCC1 family protein